MEARKPQFGSAKGQIKIAEDFEDSIFDIGREPVQIETREKWDAQPQNWPFCPKCMNSHHKDAPCIAELESAVIEAAIAARKGLSPELDEAVFDAVDALLREKAEKNSG